LEHFFHIYGKIIPTDELHHFSEGLAQPPTRRPLALADHRRVLGAAAAHGLRLRRGAARGDLCAAEPGGTGRWAPVGMGTRWGWTFQEMPGDLNCLNYFKPRKMGDFTMRNGISR